MAVITSGIDTLYLSGRASVPDSLWRDLADRKAEAQSTDAPVAYKLAGETVAVRAGGLGRYAFRLDHRYGFVGLTMSNALPGVRFQPLGEFLHGVGAENMVRWFDGWMSDAIGGAQLTAARADVFADTIGWPLEASDRHRFLCRADLRDTHEKGEEWTGFEFGRHKGGNIMGRVYNKTEDNKRTRNTWWPEIWGEQVAPGETVVRVEIEFGRAGLRSFRLDTPADVFAALGDLWHYGTHDWLTFRTPTADATKARWPIAPEWETVQTAGLTMPALGIERTYGAKDESSYRALLPGLTGYVSAVAARQGADGIEEALVAVRQALRDYERLSGVRFNDRVAHKLWRNALP